MTESCVAHQHHQHHHDDTKHLQQQVETSIKVGAVMNLLDCLSLSSPKSDAPHHEDADDEDDDDDDEDDDDDDENCGGILSSFRRDNDMMMDGVRQLGRFYEGVMQTAASHETLKIATAAILVRFLPTSSTSLPSSRFALLKQYLLSPPLFAHHHESHLPSQIASSTSLTRIFRDRIYPYICPGKALLLDDYRRKLEITNNYFFSFSLFRRSDDDVDDDDDDGDGLSWWEDLSEQVEPDACQDFKDVARDVLKVNGVYLTSRDCHSYETLLRRLLKITFHHKQQEDAPLHADNGKEEEEEDGVDEGNDARRLQFEEILKLCLRLLCRTFSGGSSFSAVLGVYQDGVYPGSSIDEIHLPSDTTLPSNTPQQHHVTSGRSPLVFCTPDSDAAEPLEASIFEDFALLKAHTRFRILSEEESQSLCFVDAMMTLRLPFHSIRKNPNTGRWQGRKTRSPKNDQHEAQRDPNKDGIWCCVALHHSLT